MIGYIKSFQDDELLKRYNNEIWEKISNTMETGFDG